MPHDKQLDQSLSLNKALLNVLLTHCEVKVYHSFFLWARRAEFLNRNRLENGLFDKTFLGGLQESSRALPVSAANLCLFDLSHHSAISFRGN